MTKGLRHQRLMGAKIKTGVYVWMNMSTCSNEEEAAKLVAPGLNLAGGTCVVWFSQLFIKQLN